MSEFIKPCPFCGSHNVGVSRTNDDACWLSCDECGAESSSTSRRSNAIAIWNNRTKDDGKPATVTYDMDAEFYAAQAAEPTTLDRMRDVAFDINDKRIEAELKRDMREDGDWAREYYRGQALAFSSSYGAIESAISVEESKGESE